MASSRAVSPPHSTWHCFSQNGDLLTPWDQFNKSGHGYTRSVSDTFALSTRPTVFPFFYSRLPHAMASSMTAAGSAAAARAASSPHPQDARTHGHDATAPGDATATRKPLSFDCNICLDAVASPVVTLCGHLYCWPCLYLWMAQHSECPVCKAGISEDNVVPVYGRGADAVDPRTAAQHNLDGSETQIPDRPRGQRLDPELLRRRRPRYPLGGFSSSPTLGIFPAFFGGGGPFGPTPSPTHHADGSPLTPQEAQQQMQQAFLSRLLLIVGSLVLLCLLTF